MSEHDNNGLGHILPFKVYVRVLLALVVLTVLTVYIAKGVEFESDIVTISVAMFIASIKAGIVALFFMHLKYENPITWLYAFFPIFLLFTLIGGVFLDNPLR